MFIELLLDPFEFPLTCSYENISQLISAPTTLLLMLEGHVPGASEQTAPQLSAN